MSAADFGAAYRRIQDATGMTTQTSLARVLGVSQASVWEAIRRDAAIPAPWLVTLVDRYGLSPRWIRTGEGAQTLRIIEDVPIEELCAEIVRRWGERVRA